MKKAHTLSELETENETLRSQLEEANANLEAIRSGAADAIVVQTQNGISVFTIQGAETAYRTMVETMNEGAVTVDSNGNILYANARFCSMIEVHCSLLVGQQIQKIIPEHLKVEFYTFLDKTCSNGNCCRDFEFLRRDASILPVYLSCAPIEISGNKDICIVVSDLTERKVAQQKLIEVNNNLELRIKERTQELEYLTLSLEQQVFHRTSQVRKLAKALTLAEQRQRQRLSTILHDDLQQTLFAARSRCNLIVDSIKEGTYEDVKDDLVELTNLTSRALEKTKILALEFNPPVLHTEGLDAALKWLIYHFQKSYGLNIELKMDEPLAIIREDEQVLIVNLIRELLFNVIKHAGTGLAYIIVSKDINHIFVQVEDKGIGFDLEKEKALAHEQTHMGLFSIEERLLLFGGNLDIKTEPGSGTKIIMTLPFDIEKKQLNVG
jgi:PAS domain S-box-containing protein